jgi:hypothetical protein
MSSSSSSSTHAAAAATNDVSDWHLERDRARKEAMDWFQSFHTSAEMIKAGYKVRCPIYDLAYRQGARPVRFGIEYDLKGETETYELAMDKWNATEHSAEDSEYKPMEPLTPATYSFWDGPNQQYEDMAQVAKFDRVTLFNIVMAHAEKEQESLLRNGLAAESHAQLVQRVQAVIKDQSALAEMAIEYNPVLELVSGILVLDNWKWLSAADLTKWNLAVDSSSLIRHSPKEKADGILEEQVRMYKEILTKRWGDSARGYSLFRARCQDNQKSLGRPLSIQDEPDDNVREKLVRQEAVLQQMVQSIPNGTPAAQVAQELLALVPTTTLHRSLRGKRKVDEAAVEASSNKEARPEASA